MQNEVTLKVLKGSMGTIPVSGKFVFLDNAVRFDGAGGESTTYERGKAKATISTVPKELLLTDASGTSSSYYFSTRFVRRGLLELANKDQRMVIISQYLDATSQETPEQVAVKLQPLQHEFGKTMKITFILLALFFIFVPLVFFIVFTVLGLGS